MDIFVALLSMQLPQTRRFAYDEENRLTAVREFLWDGCKLLLELDGSNMVLRKYTYGLALAGQSGGSTSGRSMLEGAGTTLDTAAPHQGQVGGLLAVEQRRVGGSPLKYVYLYDGNGNVGQVIDLSAASATAALKVKYEYDPYGARTNTPGEGEYDQPFRFSTKYFDAETGFLYFGGRYYQPSLGRWLNRDPIEEAGGENLYAYAFNDPIDRIDPLGYVWCQHPEDCGGGNDSGPWACQEGGEDSPPKPEPPNRSGTPVGGNEDYGTCSDCPGKCKRSSRALGLTVYEDGNVCWCICAKRIHGDREKKHPGLREGNNIVEECVRDHESVHVAGGKPPEDGTNTECAADRAAAVCILNNVGRCSGLKVEGPAETPRQKRELENATREERCRCLEKLEWYLDDYVTCEPDKLKDGKPGPACPKGEGGKCKEQLQAAKDAVTAQQVALGCPGHKGK